MGANTRICLFYAELILQSEIWRFERGRLALTVTKPYQKKKIKKETKQKKSYTRITIVSNQEKQQNGHGNDELEQIIFHYFDYKVVNCRWCAQVLSVWPIQWWCWLNYTMFELYRTNSSVLFKGLPTIVRCLLHCKWSCYMLILPVNHVVTVFCLSQFSISVFVLFPFLSM